MKGLVSLKIERPYLFDGIVEECVRRNLISEWWALATPLDVLETVKRTGHYARVLGFTEFLRLGGEPRESELDEIERRHGTPTLRDVVVADRRLFTLDAGTYAHNPAYRGFSHEEVMRVIGRAFLAAEKILDELQPQLVLLESCVAVDELALYHVARARGIPAILIMDARVGNRWFLSENPRGISKEITSTAVALREGRTPATPEERRFAEEHLSAIRERLAMPAACVDALDWIAEKREVRVGRVLGFPLKAARAFLKDREEARDNPYVPNPLRAVPDRIGYRWRILRDRRLVGWEKPVAGERFVYFPLQMQPEASTSLYAPAYLDQVALVEAIARSIPITWRLYVKEHPVMLGARPWSFYRRLQAVPSVRLIDPTVQSHDLIRTSRLVCSITGTAAWEAAAIGTPAILFGETVFSGCRGIATFDETATRLASFVHDVLDGRRLDGAFDPVDYLVAVLRNTFPADTITFAGAPGMVAAGETARIVDELGRRIKGAGRSTGD